MKRILMGVPPAQAASVESLADPKSLDYFVAMADELQQAPIELTARAPSSARRSPS